MHIAVHFPHNAIGGFVAAGLKARKEIKRVDILPAGNGFMRALRATDAQLFLLDGMSINATLMVDRLQRIRRAHPDKPILLLASEHREILRTALQHGVTGVVKPDGDVESCIEALLQLRQGHTWLPADLVGELVSGRSPASAANGPSSLSARQRQVLDLLGNGMTVREIADLLGIGAKTVETHRARLMQQLGARSSHELLVMAVQGRPHA